MEQIFSTSEKADINYLFSVVKITNTIPIPKADRIQSTVIEGYNVIVSKSVTQGTVGLFFVVESRLSENLLRQMNLFRHKEKNADTEKSGFFEDSGRIKAIKMRDVKSEGYFIPLADLYHIYPQLENDFNHDFINNSFDTIYGERIVRKFYLKEPRVVGEKGDKQAKVNNKLKDLLVEKQFRFHPETSHLGRNVHNVEPTDKVVITSKLHGSSFIGSKVLINKPLNWLEKLAIRFNLPVSIETQVYGSIFSSGKPKSNLPKGIVGMWGNKNGDEDLWKSAYDVVEDFLLNGMSIYGELVGFTPYGSAIQRGYDYGEVSPNHKLYVYRVTMTNVDGHVLEYTWEQVKEFCDRHGLAYVPELYSGKAMDLFPELSTSEHWNENFLEKLQAKYLNKTLPNGMPDEGIVLTVQKPFVFQPYKLKDSKFLRHETEEIDKGVVDVETEANAESTTEEVE